MAKLLIGIEGERFPKIGEQQIYKAIFSPNAKNIEENKILWQLYHATEYDDFTPISFSGQKKGLVPNYTFLKNLLHTNLLLRVSYNEEVKELRITPKENDEVKIIDVFFTDLEYKILNEQPQYLNSVNLQIYTINMKNKSIEFKIFYVLDGKEIVVAKSNTPLIVTQNNGIVKTKQPILLHQGMAMQTMQDLSAREHCYQIKLWEVGNESNIYEDKLKVRNEIGKLCTPTNVTPVKTGKTEKNEKKKKEEENTKCGIQYRKSITCVKYGSMYGPLYNGSIKLANYKKWDLMVTSGIITEENKEILIAMSENEGNLDAVQSYDSEILTAGAMQKTINPDGYGELSTQLWEFKKDNPNKFKDLFENCGWDVKEEGKKYRAYYQGVTGNKLKSLIRKGFEQKTYKQKVTCIPIEPFINACKDEDFQEKQIIDFIKRLNNAINKTPLGYKNPIKDFIKSKLGKATVLDHDVNRPGHTVGCFTTALNRFFSLNSRISKNPLEWGDRHNKYEKELLEIYGPLRGQKPYTMTDADKRYLKIKGKL